MKIFKDKQTSKTNFSIWQLVNTIVPSLVLAIIIGMFYNFKKNLKYEIEESVIQKLTGVFKSIENKIDNETKIRKELIKYLIEEENHNIPLELLFSSEKDIYKNDPLRIGYEDSGLQLCAEEIKSDSLSNKYEVLYKGHLPDLTEKDISIQSVHKEVYILSPFSQTQYIVCKTKLNIITKNKTQPCIAMTDDWKRFFFSRNTEISKAWLASQKITNLLLNSNCNSGNMFFFTKQQGLIKNEGIFYSKELPGFSFSPIYLDSLKESPEIYKEMFKVMGLTYLDGKLITNIHINNK